jgi:deaminated glutathione amidase
MTVNVAVAQMPPAKPASESLAMMRGLVEQAAAEGAQLVVFPEGSMHDFGLPDIDLSSIAEAEDGPWLTGLIALAGEFGVTIAAGMWAKAASGGRVRNLNVVVNGSGLIAKYQKSHLFDSFGFKESDVVEPGAPVAVTFELDGMRFGLTTCYDIRFPELYSCLALDGVDAIIVSAGWVAGPGKVDQWETLLKARAIETTSYVIGAGLSGERFAGHSSLWDPFGICLAGLSDETAVILAPLSKERVEEVRGILPSLQHKRFAVAPATAK